MISYLASAPRSRIFPTILGRLLALPISILHFTFPNKWWLEHTKGADIAIHECFITPDDLIKKQKWTPGAALNVGTQVHTSPAQFGKVMSDTKPRLAVGYHFFNDFDTQPNVMAEVRKTYDGPLALATDYMVFNVTKDDIKVRMAVVDEDI